MKGKRLANRDRVPRRQTQQAEEKEGQREE